MPQINFNQNISLENFLPRLSLIAKEIWKTVFEQKAMNLLVSMVTKEKLDIMKLLKIMLDTQFQLEMKSYQRKSWILE